MHNEHVFTPKWLVTSMLNHIGYYGNDILGKHIIDNSCGDGSFLCEIVERYIESSLTIGDKGIKKGLENFIHGIEVNPKYYNETICNLNKIALKHNIVNVNWNIINGNTLDISIFNGRMDFVVGNPPYCNVHHLGDSYDKIKSFEFTKKGMTDLYIAFFEIGIKMLNNNGKLLYITPSSWINSIAGKSFREWLVKTKKLNSIVDIKGYKVFDKATTFTMITEIGKHTEKYDLYYPNVENNKIITDNPFIFVGKYSLADTIVDGNLYTASIDEINRIKSIKSASDKRFIVRNGFATLNDKLFRVNNNLLPNVIKVIKASKNIEEYFIFPYDKLGNININNETYSFLKKRANEMNLDTEKENWYAYGRYQAIKDVYKDKISVTNLVKDNTEIKIGYAPSGVGVYSGFYILDKCNEFNTVKQYRNILGNKFISYVKSLGKYKNGGYYTFSTKELEDYLNFIIK